MLLGSAMAGQLMPPPEGLAEVTVTDETGEVHVVLELAKCWADKGLADGGDPNAQMHPLHTGLEPKVVKAKGSETCLWTGHRLSAHEQPGDTVVTYALLAQATGEQVQAVWYEDHMEVPRTYYRATGTLSGRDLVLDLAGELGPPAKLVGLVNREP